MLSGLARLLGLRPNPTLTVEHSVLGKLRYDGEVSAWRTTVDTNSGPIGFLIAGAEVPDDQLIQHAVEIVAAPAVFLGKVRAFLQQEATAHPELAAEIAGLSLQEVCLFWPDRPSDGMLYFGSDEPRVWRCDYVNKAPIGLGFDS
jgi:hypothetical protein